MLQWSQIVLLNPAAFVVIATQGDAESSLKYTFVFGNWCNNLNVCCSKYTTSIYSYLNRLVL